MNVQSKMHRLENIVEKLLLGTIIICETFNKFPMDMCDLRRNMEQSYRHRCHSRGKRPYRRRSPNNNQVCRYHCKFGNIHGHFFHKRIKPTKATHCGCNVQFWFVSGRDNKLKFRKQKSQFFLRKNLNKVRFLYQIPLLIHSLKIHSFSENRTLSLQNLFSVGSICTTLLTQYVLLAWDQD